jgi:hypothetical protein
MRKDLIYLISECSVYSYLTSLILGLWWSRTFWWCKYMKKAFPLIVGRKYSRQKRARAKHALQSHALMTHFLQLDLTFWNFQSLLKYCNYLGTKLSVPQPLGWRGHFISKMQHYVLDVSQSKIRILSEWHKFNIKIAKNGQRTKFRR